MQKEEPVEFEKPHPDFEGQVYGRSKLENTVKEYSPKVWGGLFA